MLPRHSHASVVIAFLVAIWYCPPATRACVPGTWTNGTPLPVTAGEVSMTYFPPLDLVFLVGQNTLSTWAYNVTADQWLPEATYEQRSFQGNHMASVMFNNKVYLFGGLSAGGGAVQIFDPFQPFGSQWQLGKPFPSVGCSDTPGSFGPWTAGSVAVGHIDDRVYVCGGIVGSVTVPYCAVYNLRLNHWNTSMACMGNKATQMDIRGRNHASGGVIGGRYFYIFGGRTGKNVVSPGYYDVFVFDTVTGTWSSTTDPGSTIPQMIIPHAGSGAAVNVDDELYIFGGESNLDPTVTKYLSSSGTWTKATVFNRNTGWRIATTLPTARHGLWPILLPDGRIMTATGGTHYGRSFSSVVQFYCPHRVVPPPTVNISLQSQSPASLRFLVRFSSVVSGFGNAGLLCSTGCSITTVAPRNPRPGALNASEWDVTVTVANAVSAVSLWVPEGVCADAATGLPNAASANGTWTVESALRLTVAVSRITAPSDSPIVLEITASRAVLSWNESAISCGPRLKLSGVMRKNDSTVTVTLAPNTTISHDVLSVTFDEAFLQDVNSIGMVPVTLQLTFYATKLSATMMIANVEPESRTLVVSLSFPIPVIGLNASSFTVSDPSRAMIASVQGSGTNFSVVLLLSIGISESSQFALVLPEGVCTDEFGQPNVASSVSIVLDSQPPVATLLLESKRNASPIALTILFNEPVGGLNESVIDCSPASVAKVSTVVSLNATAYRVTVSVEPSAALTAQNITVSLRQNSVIDISGQTNPEPAVYILRYDPVPPATSVTLTKMTGSLVRLKFDFSEAVVPFTASSQVMLLSGTFVAGSELSHPSMANGGIDSVELLLNANTSAPDIPLVSGFLPRNSIQDLAGNYAKQDVGFELANQKLPDSSNASTKTVVLLTTGLIAWLCVVVPGLLFQ